MKKQAVQSVTSLPPSPDEERGGRMRKYLIVMGVRVACFLVVFVVPGWWRLIPIIATVVLPYIAVVIANTASRVPAPVLVGRRELPAIGSGDAGSREGGGSSNGTRS